MAEENSWQAKIEEGTRATTPEVIASVPPPPPEVKIRTMRSDLESMAKGGGSLPHFETVKAPGLKILSLEESKKEAEKSSDKSFWLIASVIAVVVISGVIYFGYQIFKGQQGSPAPSGSVVPVPAAPSASTPANQEVLGPTPEFVHSSFFKKPAEETLTFIAKSQAENTQELRTFGQKMFDVLAAAKKETKFIEILFKDDSGRDLSLSEVLSLSGSLVLPGDFLLAKFNPDPTVFVYRNANGSWPGYVFELKPSENWLFLKDDIIKLEKSAKLENFFLVSPGQASGGFEDVVISTQPARKLVFSSGATFVYGWVRPGRLILSSSEDGLKEALARL